MLEPFKYMIQCVAIERDEQGQIVREVPAETQSAYRVEQAQEIITKFQQEIARLNSEGQPQLQGGMPDGNGTGDGNQDYVRQSQVSGPPQFG